MRDLSLMFVAGSMSTKSSGPYLSLLQTAQQLQKRGHHISVLGTRELRESGTPLEWQAFDSRIFPKLGPASLHFGLGVTRWLRHVRPAIDVMSLEGVWLHIGASVARWCVENKIPYVITAHGNFNPVALAISSWKKRIALKTFAGKLLRDAACFHALNAAEHRAIRDYGLKQPVFIVPNGIEIPDETPMPIPDTIQQHCAGRRICLYLGRLHPIKGLDRLLNAWSVVRPGAEWQLVLAGGDADGYLPQLRCIVREKHLADSVSFVGYVDGETKAAWLRIADFFVLPSHSEGMPMAALEALSYGTPALLTDACNLQQAATAGGAMIVPSSEQGIRDGLSEMTSKTRQELLAMGRLGRCFAQAEYDWSAICCRLESVYAWIAGNGDRPECVLLQ